MNRAERRAGSISGGRIALAIFLSVMVSLPALTRDPAGAGQPAPNSVRRAALHEMVVESRGPADADPDWNLLVEALSAERRAGDSPPGGRTTAGRHRDADLRVCFGDRVPEEVQAAARRAAAAWEADLALDIPIDIDLYWIPFQSDSTLAVAGPSLFIQDAQLPDPAVEYPVALASQLLGRDLSDRAPCDLADDPDILVLLNSGAGGDESFWHISVGPPPDDAIDLDSVLLHEIAHGLGIVTSADLIGDHLHWPAIAPALVYDTRFVRCRGSSAAGCDGAAAVAIGDIDALTSRRLWFDAGNTDPLQLHAPTWWTTGSSVVHLDEARYGSALMTPFLDPGDRTPGIDHATLAILQSLGYSLKQQPGPPRLVITQPGDATITIDFDPPSIDTGPPPTAYEVVVADARDERSFVVERGPVTVPAENGREYEVRVRAGNAGGVGPFVAGPIVVPLALAPFADTDELSDLLISRLTLGAPLSDRAAIVDTASNEGPVSGLARAFDEPIANRLRELTRLYVGLFARPPDPHGFRFWAERIAGGTSMNDVARSFLRSPEWSGDPDRPPLAELSPTDQVVTIHEQILRRRPDPAEVAVWLERLALGDSPQAMVRALLRTPEFDLIVGQSDEGFVVYQTLLERQPTDVESGRGRTDSIEDIIFSDEFLERLRRERAAEGLGRP